MHQAPAQELPDWCLRLVGQGCLGPTGNSGSRWVWGSPEILFSFPSLESDLHSVLQKKRRSELNPQVLQLRNLPSLPQNPIPRCSTRGWMTSPSGSVSPFTISSLILKLTASRHPLKKSEKLTGGRDHEFASVLRSGEFDTSPQPRFDRIF